jgi:hypothetical protein
MKGQQRFFMERLSFSLCCVGLLFVIISTFHSHILHSDFQSVYFMRIRLKMKALEVCGTVVGTAKHQQGLEACTLYARSGS